MDISHHFYQTTPPSTLRLCVNSPSAFYLRVRSHPSLMADEIGGLSNGAIIEVLAQAVSGFYCLADGKGFVKQNVTPITYTVLPHSSQPLTHTSNPISPSIASAPICMQFCAECGKSGKHRCARCKHTCYCSTACQKAAWPTHKLSCIRYSSDPLLQPSTQSQLNPPFSSQSLHSPSVQCDWDTVFDNLPVPEVFVQMNSPAPNPLPEELINPSLWEPRNGWNHLSKIWATIQASAYKTYNSIPETFVVGPSNPTSNSCPTKRPRPHPKPFKAHRGSFFTLFLRLQSATYLSRSSSTPSPSKCISPSTNLVLSPSHASLHNTLLSSSVSETATDYPQARLAHNLDETSSPPILPTPSVFYPSKVESPHPHASQWSEPAVCPTNPSATAIPPTVLHFETDPQTLAPITIEVIPSVSLPPASSFTPHVSRWKTRNYLPLYIRQPREFSSKLRLQYSQLEHRFPNLCRGHPPKIKHSARRPRRRKAGPLRTITSLSLGGPHNQTPSISRPPRPSHKRPVIVLSKITDISTRIQPFPPTGIG